MMKRYACLLTAALLLCHPVAAPASSVKEETGKALTVVTTIFPAYDWTLQILGDNPADVRVSMLAAGGVDLHSYQPSADDVLQISSADLIICVGGESEQWMKDALAAVGKEEEAVISLLDVLGEDAQAEEEALEEEAEDPGEGTEYDEHVWLSLRNASRFCDVIAERLGEADPVNSDLYQADLEAYRGELDELDAAFTDVTRTAKTHTLLFGDRFPFRYLTEDYGLEYYAAFSGCSAETEASFETIAFLAAKTDELGLHTILKIEGSDGKIAETIRANTAGKDQKILELDSLQSVTEEELAEGLTYLSAMSGNLQVIKEAL